jgi:hypothetical protein
MDTRMIGARLEGDGGKGYWCERAKHCSTLQLGRGGCVVRFVYEFVGLW